MKREERRADHRRRREFAEGQFRFSLPLVVYLFYILTGNF
jgi:hypothetical protein